MKQRKKEKRIKRNEDNLRDFWDNVKRPNIWIIGVPEEEDRKKDHGFILFGTLWVSWTWVIISFPILGKFSTIISSSIFSWSFFLSSSSGTPIIQMLGRLTLSQKSLRLSSFLLIRFSFFLSFIYFYHSISYLTYPIFCLHYSTVGSLQSVFYLIYCIIYYILAPC